MKKLFTLISAALVMMSAYSAFAQTFKTTFIGTSSSNGVTIQPDNAGSAYTLTLPPNDGDASEVLTTNGSGTLSWGAVSGLTHFTEALHNAGPNAVIPVTQLIATNAAANVDIALTPKGTGALLAQVPDLLSSGGNKRGSNAVDWQTVRNVSTHVASGTNATIGGGSWNTASGNNAVVAGGTGNTASGGASTVAGGAGNTAGGNNFAFVGGGQSNTASGWWSVIAGGNSNIASNNETFVGSGTSCNASGFRAAIGGGIGNGASGDHTFIGGGSSNSASGEYSHISGGFQATASNYGQQAHASGRFATNGDAQTSVYVVRNTTSDATATDLYLDGGTAPQRISVAANTGYIFKVIVIGMTQNAGSTATYELTGAITRDNANNTALVYVNQENVNEPAAGWDATAIADNANEALVIQVTGAAGTNVRWVARVETTEVTFP